MNKAVFIDKDGTLILDVPYNANPSLIQLYDDALKSLRLLKESDYLLIMISNQSGIAHGYFKEPALEDIKLKIQLLLAEEDIEFDGFYFCPHHPQGSVKQYAIDCDCR